MNEISVRITPHGEYSASFVKIAKAEQLSKARLAKEIAADYATYNNSNNYPFGTQKYWNGYSKTVLVIVYASMFGMGA